MKKPLRWLVMTVLALAGMLTMASGRASAQDPQVLLSDLQIMVQNAPAAGDELAAGLQNAIDVLSSTQSAEQTSAAIGDAFVNAGGALVAGTEQFGALGLGLTLMNLGFQAAISPVVVDIIDEQNPQAVLDPAHLELILANLPAMLEHIQSGDEAGCTTTDGVVHLLEGNILEPPLGIGPAFWSCFVINILLAGFNATMGTPLEGTFQFLGISSIVIGAAAEPQVTELEVALAPVFDALAPVTDPIIAALEGV